VAKNRTPDQTGGRTLTCNEKETGQKNECKGPKPASREGAVAFFSENRNHEGDNPAPCVGANRSGTEKGAQSKRGRKGLQEGGEETKKKERRGRRWEIGVPFQVREEHLKGEPLNRSGKESPKITRKTSHIGGNTCKGCLDGNQLPPLGKRRSR